MYTDFLIKVKNAQKAGKKTLKIRFTKMDNAIAEVLEEKGFVKKIEVKGKPVRRIIEIDLDGKRKIRGLKFLSRPSLRRYAGYKELWSPMSGQGLLIISTSNNIMTSLEAKKKKLGGQLLFEIW